MSKPTKEKRESITKELIDHMTNNSDTSNKKFIKNKMYDKDGHPKCIYCGKAFVNGYDSIEKKISEYIWKPDCDCYPKDLRLMTL